MGEKRRQAKEKYVTIQASWNRIETWLKQYAPEEFSSLEPGATDQDIQQAETALGITLPEEVRASYHLHNGGAHIADPGSHFLWELQCLEDIVDDWNTSRKIDHGLLVPILPEDQVQPRQWDLHWIPLLSDPGFGCLCLDLAPGPAGQGGQIVEVIWENPDPRPVIAASFQELLHLYAEQLEAGEYTWNEEDGILEYGGFE